MKKCLTFLLVLTMLFSMLTTVSASVEEESAYVDSSLVFSLDLSDGIVKNGVSGNSSVVTDGTGNEIKTVDRTGTKYLDIGNGVAVTDSAINAAASNAITLEWWAKLDAAPPSGWMASLRNESGKYNLKVQPVNNHVAFETEYDATKIRVSMNTDYVEWAHYVVTRSYDSTTSTGELKAYVNGYIIDEGTFTGTQYTVDTLNIGRAYGTTATFAGNIGSFKVYNTVLDASTIKSKYDASISDYYYTDPSGLIFSMDLSDSTDSNVVVKDVAEDLVTETITIGANNTIGEIAGTGKKYLQLAASGATGVNVVDSAVNTAANSAITYELWSKAGVNTSTSGWMLGHYNGSKYAMKAMNINNSINQLGFEVEYANKTSGHPRVTQVEVDHTSWTHWVITKSYDSSTSTGEITVYRNGELQVSTGYDNPKAISEALPNFGSSATLNIGKARGDNTAAFTNGAIAECNVYSKVLSAADAKAKYDAGKNNFISPLIDLVSVSPDGGTVDTHVDIEPNAGTFTIIFDNSVSQSSLDAITFAKVGGDPISINASVSLESDKKVIVSYDSLDELSDYVLTIGPELSSSFGSEMDKTYEFYYHTLEKPSPIFLDIDFESDEYVVGQAPAGNDGLTYISTGVADSTDNFLIREKNGDKYLTYSVSQAETASSSQLLYEFPEAVTNRSMIIEMGIRGYVEGSETKFGTSARDVMRVYNGEGYTPLLQLSRTNSSNEITEHTTAAGFGADFTSTPADDSFNHIKFVISKDANNRYFYDVYDNTSSAVKYTRIAPTGNLAYDKITKMMLAHVYPVSSDNYDNEGVAISYIKGYYIEHPRLANTNSEYLTIKSESVKLYFDKAMDETTLASGKYVLTDSDGNTDIALEYQSYDSVENCVTLEFSDYLIPDMAYTLTAQDMLDVDGAPVAVTDSIQIALPEREIECNITGFSDESGVISALGDMSEATASLNADYTVSNNTDSERQILVFAQHCGKDGYVKKVCAQFVDVPGNTLNLTKGFTLAESTYKEDDYVVLYIWDVTDSKFKLALVTPYKLTY